MGALELVQRLAANNAWSNLRLHEACLKLTSDAFDAKRVSFFPSLPMTLNHILIVDWYYIDALENGGKGRKLFENEVPFPDMKQLAVAHRESDQRLVRFVNAMDEKALDEKVRLERRDHVQVERAIDVLMHLSVHQIHHRGQVHAMLAGTTVKPPQLDEFFLSAELPLRERELKTLGLPLR
jgi:uncharacterized damage-inducible protein DinB